MRDLYNESACLYRNRFIRVLPEEIQPYAVHVLHHPQRVPIRESYSDKLLVSIAGARSREARWLPTCDEVYRSLFRVPVAESTFGGAQPECDSAGLSSRLAPVVERIQFCDGT